MILKKTAKRIGVFAYFDADGVVDDYVPVLVASVAEHCDYLLCMVNGKLNQEDDAKLRAVADEVCYRPNEGLDITAYKEGYFRLRDAELLNEADELLFFNQTVFGPVYPLQTMFAEMARRNLDFWGLTRHKGLNADLAGTIWDKVEYGYIPPHIQSYFFAVRGSLLHDAKFDEYWNTLPVLHNYVEAVSLHEMRFTKYFEDLGFQGAPYLDCTEWESYMDYPLMGMPIEMLTHKHTPFVKRKSFFSARTEYLSVPQGAAGGDLLQYLAAHTDYDIGLILQNLTRTVPAATYTMAISPSAQPANRLEEGKTALVLWLNDLDMMPLAQKAAQSLPQGSGVYCIVDSDTLACALQAALPGAVLQVSKQNGLTCFATQILPQLAGYEYLLYLPLVMPQMDDELQNRTVAEAIFAALGDAPADLAMLQGLAGAGMLCAWPDSYGENFLSKLPLAELHELTTLLRQTCLKKLPLGTALLRLPQSAFFCRAELLEGFAELPWDAIEKANGIDLILPLFAQSKGVLCGFALPWQTAARELWNAREQLDRLAQAGREAGMNRLDLIEFRMQGIVDFYNERRYSMTLEQAYTMPLGLKDKLFIILRLLLKPQTFAKLYRLLHRGKGVPPDHTA
ncbi:rhamnan synthesis F family protein [Pygmaiobacter massiliensis]|uniref:rhamnan synthesis F family protein n=1 Tax=Pygmaiobacter massiliensis TaxID=1917873 RepID=UPI0028965A21|nr:rhamnan synthesis F family protein [Pygmaiobacter massiliensis]